MFNCFLSLYVSVQVSDAYGNVLSIIVFFSLNFSFFDKTKQSWWCIFILTGAPNCDCTKLIVPTIALIKYRMTDHVLVHTEMATSTNNVPCLNQHPSCSFKSWYIQIHCNLVNPLTPNETIKGSHSVSKFGGILFTLLVNCCSLLCFRIQGQAFIPEPECTPSTY